MINIYLLRHTVVFRTAPDRFNFLSIEIYSLFRHRIQGRYDQRVWKLQQLHARDQRNERMRSVGTAPTM